MYYSNVRTHARYALRNFVAIVASWSGRALSCRTDIGAPGRTALLWPGSAVVLRSQRRWVLVGAFRFDENATYASSIRPDEFGSVRHTLFLCSGACYRPTGVYRPAVLASPLRGAASVVGKPAGTGAGSGWEGGGCIFVGCADTGQGFV